HTTGGGLAVHSGLVLVTSEGALVIDPAMTCTADWLRDEIKRRFNVRVAYVVYTHAHADHISGAQIFQNDRAIVVANQRALEPIIGEKLPTLLSEVREHHDLRLMENSSPSAWGTCMFSLSRVEPGGDFRPHIATGFATDQDSEMLQADAELAGVLDDPHIRCLHCVDEGLDRGQRRHFIGDVHNRER